MLLLVLIQMPQATPESTWQSKLLYLVERRSSSLTNEQSVRSNILNKSSSDVLTTWTRRVRSNLGSAVSCHHLATHDVRSELRTPSHSNKANHHNLFVFDNIGKAPSHRPTPGNSCSLTSSQSRSASPFSVLCGLHIRDDPSSLSFGYPYAYKALVEPAAAISG